MVATDLNQLEVPEQVRREVPALSRDATVVPQSIRVDRRWWASAIEQRSLPGGVVTTPVGSSEDERYGEISRQDLFALSERLETVDGLSSFLWSVLAWGAGTRSRNMARRLTAFADHKEAFDVVRTAVGLAPSDPMGAYEMLRPRNRNAIAWLGPAFFTKVLYFAGGGEPHHPCLILDARVASCLHSSGWDSLRTGAWPAFTYDRYCRLLHRWAESLSTPTRQVAADEIELWLFHR